MKIQHYSEDPEFEISNRTPSGADRPGVWFYPSRAVGGDAWSGRYCHEFELDLPSGEIESRWEYQRIESHVVGHEALIIELFVPLDDLALLAVLGVFW